MSPAGPAVIINIPPFDIFGGNLGAYAQIKKSFYFGYSQTQRVIEDRIRQDDPRAALGYYRGQFAPTRFGSPGWAAEQEAAWGGSAVPRPVLYPHGGTDG